MKFRSMLLAIGLTALSMSSEAQTTKLIAPPLSKKLNRCQFTVIATARPESAHWVAVKDVETLVEEVTVSNSTDKRLTGVVSVAITPEAPIAASIIGNRTSKEPVFQAHLSLPPNKTFVIALNRPPTVGAAYECLAIRPVDSKDWEPGQTPYESFIKTVLKSASKEDPKVATPNLAWSAKFYLAKSRQTNSNEWEPTADPRIGDYAVQLASQCPNPMKSYISFLGALWLSSYRFDPFFEGLPRTREAAPGTQIAILKLIDGQGSSQMGFRFLGPFGTKYPDSLAILKLIKDFDERPDIVAFLTSFVDPSDLKNSKNPDVVENLKHLYLATDHLDYPSRRQVYGLICDYLAQSAGIDATPQNLYLTSPYPHGLQYPGNEIDEAGWRRMLEDHWGITRPPQ